MWLDDNGDIISDESAIYRPARAHSSTSRESSGDQHSRTQIHTNDSGTTPTTPRQSGRANHASFVCPVCYVELSSADALVSHYETLHEGKHRADACDVSDWEVVECSNIDFGPSDSAAAAPPPQRKAVPEKNFVASLFGESCGSILKRRGCNLCLLARGTPFSALRFTRPSTQISAKASTASATARQEHTPPLFQAAVAPREDAPHSLYTHAAQEAGASVSLTSSFRTLRQGSAHLQQRERSRLEVRCRKIAAMYQTASAIELLYKRSALEQNAASWEAHEYAAGRCDNCCGALLTSSRVAKDHCRICGRVMCTKCLVVVPPQSLGRPPPTLTPGSSAADPIEVPYDSAGSGVVVCTGQCLSVAMPMGSTSDPRTVDRFVALHQTLMAATHEMPAVVAKVSQTPGMVDNTALRRWQVLRDKSDAAIAAIAKLPLVSPGYRRLVGAVKGAYAAFLRSMLEKLSL